MTTPAHDLDPNQTLDAANELLAHLQRSGVRFLPQSNADGQKAWDHRWVPPAETKTESTPNPVAPTAKPKPAAPTPARLSRLQPVESFSATDDPYPGADLPIAERSQSLAALASTVAGCTRCDALSNCRTQTVFGEGNPQPRFVFFGESPGEEEDRSGRPFVGQPGQLLDKMIQACKLRREDTYMLNTVKCRSPADRNPEPSEVANCREYFEQQLAILRPEYIVCLGAVSAHALLKSKLSIGRLRQRFHQYHESKVVVIYHPAYLLRNPDAKKAAWADLQMLMQDAGL